VIAYSPLAKGILSGKYTPENPPPGMRSRMYNENLLKRIQPLIRRLKEIGARIGDKTTAQVALNWAICKGCVVIPGAKNFHQAQENAAAQGWSLEHSEILELDLLSSELAG